MEPVGLREQEVLRVVGAAMDVLNALGHGLHEKPDENAWVVELMERGIAFEQQRRFPVFHKSVLVTEYVPDLIAFGSLVVMPRSSTGSRTTNVVRCLTISVSPAPKSA